MSNERTYDPDEVRPSEEGIMKVLKEGNQMATDAIIELKQERIEKLCAKNRYLKAMTEQQHEEYSELKAGFDRLNALVQTWTDRSKDMRQQRNDARQRIAELGDALQCYGRHHRGCHRLTGLSAMPACDCGLDKVLTAIKEMT
jgi:chromosome segregation ATPase